MHHAVGALGIPALRAIVRPFGRFHQFFERIGVAVLQQIARLLPAEDAVGWHSPWSALEFAPAHQEFHIHRRGVELPALFAVGENGAEEAAGAGAPEKVLLVGSLLVGVARSHHHALDAEIHHLVEKGADRVWIGSIEEGGIGGYAESGGNGCANSCNGLVVAALAAYGKVVVLALAVHVDGKREIFARLKKMKFFFKKQRVGAHINVLFTCNEPFDDLVNFGMKQRLAAGNGDHRCSRFFDSLEALLGRQLLLENVGRVLNLAAAGTRQIAAEERLQHCDEGITLVPLHLLAQHISGNRPRLRYLYSHALRLLSTACSLATPGTSF